MNQLLNCKWKLEDIKHDAMALLYIRPMRQERVNWRNIFCLNVKKPNNRSKGNSNDQKWLQSPCSKAGRIKQNQPPHPPTLCLAMKRRDERASRNRNVSPSNPHNRRVVIRDNNNKWMWNFTPSPGHRRTQSRKQLPLTETWRVFFSSLHLFSDSQGFTTPAHHHGIESHGNRTRTISDFLLRAFSSKTPKGSVPDAVVRNARDKQEY